MQANFNGTWRRVMRPPEAVLIIHFSCLQTYSWLFLNLTTGRSLSILTTTPRAPFTRPLEMFIFLSSITWAFTLRYNWEGAWICWSRVLVIPASESSALNKILSPSRFSSLDSLMEFASFVCEHSWVAKMSDGDLGGYANAKTAYMKQKHRLIWERRHGPVGSGMKEEAAH